MNVISVSRRTDIPAFYGDWFMNRLHDGFAEYRNPFTHQSHSVSLKPDQVLSLVFWSKNFAPFLKHLPLLESRYHFYFHFSITGLPTLLEASVPDVNKSVDTFRFLSERYSPQHVLWRFDPIILSNMTTIDYYMKSFDYLINRLKGYTKRCYFSFVQDNYKKVKKQFDLLASACDFHLSSSFEERKKLLEFMIKEADKKGVTLYSCCQDEYVFSKIKKAHCIDKHLLETLFPEIIFNIKKAPSRKICGCFKSVDIGRYDTCPHGCVYCYANSNQQKAQRYFNNHNETSLGL